MTRAHGLPSVLSLIPFIVGQSLLVSACGSSLPSAAPLSASGGTHAMQRTRPSSARAIEPGSDDHPSVESEGPSPSDDDDDDSTGASKNRQDAGNLLSK